MEQNLGLAEEEKECNTQDCGMFQNTYISFLITFLHCLLVESSILVFSSVNESTKYEIGTTKQSSSESVCSG